MADWLDGAAERPVGDSTPLTVVGSSLGGLLARDLAARRPRQRLGIALPGAAAADTTAMARLAERYELPVPPDDRLSGHDGS